MSITSFNTPALPGGEKSNTGLVVAALIVATAGLYYFLVYKPEQDAKKAAEKK